MPYDTNSNMLTMTNIEIIVSKELSIVVQLNYRHTYNLILKKNESTITSVKVFEQSNQSHGGKV